VQLLEACWEIVAPSFCVLCHAPPAAVPWLCRTCSARLALLGEPCCLRCGRPAVLPTPSCPSCPDWPPILVAARAGAPHAGAARELVGALKRRRVLAAAQPLGRLAAVAARQLRLPRDVFVSPVPLHWSRRRKRGFDQAAEIGRIVARALGRPFRARLLRRVRPAQPETFRTYAGRARELRGVFRASRRVRGRAVLLVDDTMATGLTVGSCARALRRRGAREVWVVTATQAPARR